jgi:predicted nucleotidyltransferase
MTSKEIIIRKLKQHKTDLHLLGVREIGLFGSYIRDEQTSKSDIDILIDFEPEQENFDNYMAIYDLLEQIFNNKNVQIVTKNGISPYIGPKILKEVMYA